jgi:hypothetical protein
MMIFTVPLESVTANLCTKVDLRYTQLQGFNSVLARHHHIPTTETLSYALVEVRRKSFEAGSFAKIMRL